MGFTLSFLILLILYSTLVVVFWSFFVAFEDQKTKTEKKRVSLMFTPLIFVYFIPTTPSALSALSTFIPVFNLTFFQSNEPNEFLFFFLIIYVFNPFTFLFIFFTLVLVCFNIVSLLLLKQKDYLGANRLSFNFNVGASSPQNPVKSGRIGFWSTVSSNLSFLSLGKST